MIKELEATGEKNGLGSLSIWKFSRVNKKKLYVSGDFKIFLRWQRINHKHKLRSKNDIREHT
jgi:hypothetical protein